ncbi:MAG: CHAT domain-containing protein [Magnetococcales bacterium]|nr:CHAT domain-containing protein [Magnetococcales bacterium]
MPTPSLTFFLRDDTLIFKNGNDEQGRRTFRDADQKKFNAWQTQYRSLQIGNNLQRLSDLGQDIYRWLDGDEGWLAALNQQGADGVELVFAIPSSNAPNAEAFWAVPWEIMATGGRFLAERMPPIMPVRRLGENATPAPPKYGNFHIMFMAAAPEGETELNHEDEEIRIMDAVRSLQVGLDVEESGCLELLADRLGQEHPPEVLHLTCHGGIDGTGPFLTFEDPRGDKEHIRPDQLLSDLPMGDIPLVFVSACRTADARSGTSSFTSRLVHGGTAAVVGWDGSVNDQESTLFSSPFYQSLSRGFSVGRSAALARRDLLNKARQNPEEKKGFHWHLARITVTQTGGGPLVDKAGKKRTLWHGNAADAFLDPENRKVRVAGPREFVGRRRQTQAVIRAFRDGTRMVMLVGAGQLGKSSLAARVSQRMRGYITVVIFKDYDRQAIFQAIQEKLPPAHGIRVKQHWEKQVSEGDENLYFALKSILEKECAIADSSREMHPLLLVIDDLERILENHDSPEGFRVKESARGALSAVLRAFIDTNATESRLLFTSRHPFGLKDKGRNLTQGMVNVRLDPMTSGEREKLALAAFRVHGGTTADPDQVTDLTKRANDVSHGNPGLNRLLIQPILNGELKVAEAGIVSVETFLATGTPPPSGSDVGEMFAKMAFSSYLKCLDPFEQSAFRALTLFEIPVPRKVAILACEKMGAPESCIMRLVNLGLVHHMRAVAGQNSDLLVDRLAAAALMNHLSAEEKKDLAGSTVTPLYESWCNDQGKLPIFEQADELYRLTELSDPPPPIPLAAAALTTGRRIFISARNKTDFENARSRAIKASNTLEQTGLSPSLALARLIAECSTELGEMDVADGWFQKGMDLDSDDPGEKGRLHLKWAERLHQAGKIDEALACLEEAGTFLHAKEHERELAMVAGLRADVMMVTGDLDKAYHVRTREELPVFERLGDVREIAVTKGKVADILFARGALDEAFRVITEEQLPIFERLGDVRSIAVTKGQVADILFARGALDEAFRVLTEEQLPIFERLGDVRSIAVTKGQVADILEARGDLAGALKLHEERRPVLEQLKDEVGLIHLLFNVSQIRLQLGRLTRETLSQILNDLIDAFDRIRRLGRPDGIGAIGFLLGQVYAAIGARDRALEVWIEAEAGFRKIDRRKEADQVAELIQEIKTIIKES